MIIQKEIILPDFGRGYHIITQIIQDNIPNLPEMGIMNIFLKHTSAALTLNENADPTVRIDFESFTNHLIPDNFKLFKHTFEGPDDMPAHLKSSFFGNSITIPITDNQLNLGTWQGIYLCEFRNGKYARKLVITVYN